jgi:flagellar motor switch protein FliN/FliY
MTANGALTPLDLYEAFAREMATAVAALLGETATLSAAVDPPAAAWTVRIAATGTFTGTLTVGLSEADGRSISALVMGLDGAEAPDDTVLDTLREIAGQAIGALSQLPEMAGLALSVDAVEPGALESVIGAWTFTLPGDLTPVLSLHGTLAVTAVAPRPGPVAVPALPVVAVPTAAGSNLDMLLDIQLPLSVRFGQAELTLQTLTRLGPGSVIDLHRSADEPVDLMVSGKVIARGEVVVVEGNYGVRVTEVVSTADRIRSMGD